MTLSKKFLFSETNFERSAKTRENSQELTRLLKHSKTKHILVWRGKILFDFSLDEPRIGQIAHYDNFWNSANKVNIKNGTFIGFQDQSAIFYHNIPDWNNLETNELTVSSFSDETRNLHPSLSKDFAFCEIRSLMTVIEDADTRMLAAIKGLFEWNKVNSFCSNCGVKTLQVLSGWERICKSCNLKHFPRTDPVVIMMVYHKDKALLGRSYAWPKGMFSCLAGFMEPGESIEAAVARETFEETGVHVQNIKYITSQPWPFPASLMIGCIAEAKSDSIIIDQEELEDARWFTKTEIRKALEKKREWWPAREGSIARFLINQWVAEAF